MCAPLRTETLESLNKIPKHAYQLSNGQIIFVDLQVYDRVVMNEVRVTQVRVV